MKLEYILDDEQPTTCPACGSRTEFIEITSQRQVHRCLDCGFSFVGVFEKDNEGDDVE